MSEPCLVLSSLTSVENSPLKPKTLAAFLDNSHNILYSHWEGAFASPKLSK
jgi:hypothetical protein